MLNFPFPTDALTANGTAELLDYMATADAFKAAIGHSALWSVGAHNAVTVPGSYQLGGIALHARILPMTPDGRGSSAVRMGVLVSLTPADEIDIDVRHHSDGRVHAQLEGLYIDQLQRAFLALDYDAKEVLNPRYW